MSESPFGPMDTKTAKARIRQARLEASYALKVHEARQEEIAALEAWVEATEHISRVALPLSLTQPLRRSKRVRAKQTASAGQTQSDEVRDLVLGTPGIEWTPRQVFEKLGLASSDTARNILARWSKRGIIARIERGGRTFYRAPEEISENEGESTIQPDSSPDSGISDIRDTRSPGDPDDTATEYQRRVSAAQSPMDGSIAADITGS